MNAERAERGFEWAARRSELGPPERESIVELIRAVLPQDRAEARRVQDQLPRRWADALRAILRGEPRPPIVAAMLLDRLRTLERPSPASPLFGHVDELRSAIEAIGVRAVAIATDHLDRRSRMRLARELPDPLRDAIVSPAPDALGETARAVIRDAFITLTDPEARLTDRVDSLGTYVIAFATADDPAANAKIADLLVGRERNRFLDYTTAGRRSSRRSAASELLEFLEAALHE